MNRLIISIILCISINLGVGHARRLNVPADYQTIQTAITSANNGDTVLVQPGVYSENISLNTRSILIGSLLVTTGDPAYIDSTVIDGGGNGPAVTFMPRNRGATLKGLTIRRGGGGFGGGVYARHESSQVIEDLLVIDNHVNGQGGGFYGNTNSETIMRRVRFIDNSAAETGGGIMVQFSRLSLLDCDLTQNRASTGAAIYSLGSQLGMTRVLAAQNVNSNGTYAISVTGSQLDQGLLFDHLTVADNVSDNVDIQTGMLLFASDRTLNITLANSILTGNGDREIELRSDPDGQASNLSVGYTDLVGGQDRLQIDENSSLNWGNGNIDRDPVFVDPENINYRLDPDSPCVDAGDPNYNRDSDGSRTDQGRFYMERLNESYLGGAVLNWFGRPIAGAVVDGFFAIGDDFHYQTNDQGRWGGRVFFRTGTIVQIDYTAPGYQFFSHEFPFDGGPDDSVRIDVRLHQARFIPSFDTVAVRLRQGQTNSLDLHIENSGDAPAHWRAKVRTEGEAGLPSLSVRREFPAGRIAGDDKLEGVAFAGNRLYVAGSNDDDPNMIYIFNLEGALRGAFRQPDTSRQGFKDLEWDGELIWGINNGIIWGISPAGEVIRRFAEPINGASNVAFDQETGILWVSSTTSAIMALDREGNRLEQTLDRRGLRIYGLGWLHRDVDDANLIILNRPDNSRSRITKMNVATGDTMTVGEVGEIENVLKGISVADEIDRYGASALVTIVNRSIDSGSDGVQVVQLYPNDEWLVVSPESGEVLPNRPVGLTVDLRTSGGADSWAFEPGLYKGEIEFTTDAAEGDFAIPVSLTVSDLGVAEGDDGLPTEFGLLSAFPNPFNSMTRLTFSAGAQSLAPLRLAIYDIGGRLVADLTPGIPQPIAEYTITWDASGLPGGIYFVRLEAGVRTNTIKAVLMK